MKRTVIVGPLWFGLASKCTNAIHGLSKRIVLLWLSAENITVPSVHCVQKVPVTVADLIPVNPWIGKSGSGLDQQHCLDLRLRGNRKIACATKLTDFPLHCLETTWESRSVVSSPCWSCRLRGRAAGSRWQPQGGRRMTSTSPSRSWSPGRKRSYLKGCFKAARRHEQILILCYK